MHTDILPSRICFYLRAFSGYISMPWKVQAFRAGQKYQGVKIPKQPSINDGQELVDKYPALLPLAGAMLKCVAPRLSKGHQCD